MKLQGSGCGLDTDATYRSTGSVVWQRCRIGGNGSDWRPGLHITHWLRGGSRMHVMLGYRK